MVGEFYLLEPVFGEVWVAPEVQNEVVVLGAGKAGSAEVAAAKFLKVKAADPSFEIPRLQASENIGAGEAATIILASQLRADCVLLDDKQARKVAKARGLRVAGTIRVLELAYERGLIRDLTTVYRRLLTTNGRIRPELLNESLSHYRLPPLS